MGIWVCGLDQDLARNKCVWKMVDNDDNPLISMKSLIHP